MIFFFFTHGMFHISSWTHVADSLEPNSFLLDQKMGELVLHTPLTIERADSQKKIFKNSLAGHRLILDQLRTGHQFWISLEVEDLPIHRPCEYTTGILIKGHIALSSQFHKNFKKAEDFNEDLQCLCWITIPFQGVLKSHKNVCLNVSESHF